MNNKTYNVVIGRLLLMAAAFLTQRRAALAVLRADALRALGESLVDCG